MYLYCSFLIKLHPCPLLLLIYFYRFFLFVLLRDHQILEQVETLILLKNSRGSHRVDFAEFSRTIRNWWGKLCVSHVVKYIIRQESDERKVPIFWGQNGYEFPSLSLFNGFHSIFPSYRTLMAKPMHFTIMKYTIGFESNGKKAPMLWEKYEYQFPRFSTHDGFWRVFPGTNFSDFSHSMVSCYGKLMRKHMHFPYDEVYHMMKTQWEKTPIFWNKYGHPIPGLPHSMDFTVFSNAMGNWWETLCVSHVTKYKVYKVWVSISQVLPIQLVYLHFPVL